MALPSASLEARPRERRKPRGPLSRPGAALGALLGFALAVPSLAATAPVGKESWYRVEIGGEPAGFAREREEAAGGEIVSESEMELSLSRGSTRVVLRLSSRFVETAAGEPVEMTSRQEMGRLPLETTVRFLPDRLELRTTQGASSTAETLPRPAVSWLPPAAASRFAAGQVAAGAPSFSYWTVDPLLGAAPFEVTLRRLGSPEPIALPGATVVATAWEQHAVGGGDVTSTLYLDPAGTLVKSVTPLLGLDLTLLLTDRETARGGRGAPELLVRSFVRPDRPLSSPRRLARATYRLSVRGRPLPELPSAGAQRVEADGCAVRVRVETGRGGSAAEAERESYLRASPYLNYRDPPVAELAREALRDAGPTEAARAEALRAFVHRVLAQKNLATGFATASEVALSRAGDCTEHAVLLAALLRAAGLPSRVAAGLLYVEEFAGERQIFGYHMWTQALLDGRWTDLDAMTAEPFDAAHIALAVTALDDGEDLAGAGVLLASLMGALEIEVLEAEPGEAPALR